MQFSRFGSLVDVAEKALESWTVEQIQVTYYALQKGSSTRAMGDLLKAKGGNPAPKAERTKETMKTPMRR